MWDIRGGEGGGECQNESLSPRSKACGSSQSEALVVWLVQRTHGLLPFTLTWETGCAGCDRERECYTASRGTLLLSAISNIPRSAFAMATAAAVAARAASTECTLATGVTHLIPDS
ncbi:hypothetical protein MRX96_045150 [Rhipicephalus microplus]